MVLTPLPPASNPEPLPINASRLGNQSPRMTSHSQRGFSRGGECLRCRQWSPCPARAVCLSLLTPVLGLFSTTSCCRSPIQTDFFDQIYFKIPSVCLRLSFNTPMLKTLRVSRCLVISTPLPPTWCSSSLKHLSRLLVTSLLLD